MKADACKKIYGFQCVAARTQLPWKVHTHTNKNHQILAFLEQITENELLQIQSDTVCWLIMCVLALSSGIFISCMDTGQFSVA